MNRTAALLAQLLAGRSRARCDYGPTLALTADPVLPATLQQFLPLTDRTALILGSARPDLYGADLVAQLLPHLVTPYIPGTNINYALDTLQGIGPLMDHIGERGFDWANNIGGIDYNTLPDGPVVIDATGLVPSTTPNTNYFPSVIYDVGDNPGNEMRARIAWVNTDQDIELWIYFVTPSMNSLGYATLSVSTVGQVAINAYGNGFVHFAMSLPDINPEGAHAFEIQWLQDSYNVVIDGAIVHSVPVDLFYVPDFGCAYFRANVAAKTNFRVTSFFNQISSTTQLPQYEIQRGIEVEMLYPSLIFDFNTAPSNAVSFACNAYPFGESSTIPNAAFLKQGF